MARDYSSHQGQIDAQLRKLNDHGSHRRAPTVDENLSLVATWLRRRWNTKFLILQRDFISITARLVVMNGTYEATPRCQDCDTCCRCFFEAQVVRDVQRDVRLDHNVFGKRPILWLRCVAPTGASVKSEVDKLMLASSIGLTAPAYAITFLEIPLHAWPEFFDHAGIVTPK